MTKLRRVALVWEQFAPYHVDRCAAVARRLAGRADLACVEIVPKSDRYRWEVSGAVEGARKHVLFPGRKAESVSRLARYRALYRQLADADTVVLGLASSDPDVALLAARLRSKGAAVHFSSCSKADDYPRSPLGEMAKKALLRSYDGGIVAGRRSFEYYRGLGVPSDALRLGYDTLSTRRLRDLADGVEAPEWADRPFLFLGRFVEKKAIDVLLEAYARYRTVYSNPRALVLAGDGPLRGALEARAEALGIGAFVRWTGFLDAPSSAKEIARAVALVLPSREEQWGLVVNEAVALRIPVIVSRQVGARDLLVEDGKSGFVVDTGSADALATAMQAMVAKESRWDAMAARAEPLDWFADSERFADAVEDIVLPGEGEARRGLARMLAASGID